MLDELQPYEYRNIVEYADTFERTLACKEMLIKWMESKLDYIPNNSFELSLMQFNNMLTYSNTHYFRIGLHFKDNLNYLIKEYINRNKDKYPNVFKYISITGNVN